jgi:REP element-mobilizing transposase RayT
MSYTSLNYHIVFSTKQRKPFLETEHIQATCKYIGGILRNHKGCLLTGSGIANHLHLAASLHPQSNLSETVQAIKGNTSKWLHENYPELKLFRWQEGYSAFSVSQSALDTVIAYIHNQPTHHKKMTFEEELISLLKKHKIDFKPEYVFG